VSEAPPEWLVIPEADFQQSYRPAHNATRAFLHRMLVRSLAPVLQQVPTDDQLGNKPLDLTFEPPLPARLRFYVYGATQHASERQRGTFKVQLTSGIPTSEPRKLQFDRRSGVRPILVGYQMDLGVFILWDADLHDLRGGFPYSKNVQAPPDIVWGAVAAGIKSGTRRLKKTIVEETIVAARPLYLPEAIELRIRLSNRTLCNGMPNA